jgi:hypothetical protein
MHPPSVMLDFERGHPFPSLNLLAAVKDGARRTTKRIQCETQEKKLASETTIGSPDRLTQKQTGCGPWMLAGEISVSPNKLYCQKHSP